MEPMAKATAWVERHMGCRLEDPVLLEEALTHRSAGSRNYERLEFLGDAVLSFVVAEMLYREFDGASEGELSRYRASLVSGETLGEVALAHGLGEHLRLGEGVLPGRGVQHEHLVVGGAAHARLHDLVDLGKLLDQRFPCITIILFREIQG